MMKALLALPLAAAALTGCFGPRPTERLRNPERERLLASLRTDLDRLLRAAPGDAGLYFKDLDTGDAVAWRADRVFRAAGVANVFILVEVYKRDYEGTVDLDAEIDVAEVFPGAADGRAFTVDDCAALRADTGGRATVRRLGEAMIAGSSRCAANNLIRLLGGPEAATQTAHALGATRSKAPRFVGDAPAFPAGADAETTPSDAGRVLERLALLQVVSGESSRSLVQTLKLCEGGFLSKSLPPSEVEIAHATGAITGVRHDAGIFSSPKGTYVLAVLMQDLTDAAAGEAAGAAASRAVFDYIQNRPR